MMSVPCKAWGIQTIYDSIMAKVELQSCFILHSKPYRDTSNLLEVFSHEYGRVGLVARGARSNRSRMNGILQPFIPLLASWSGQGELQTLTHAEQDKRAYHLKADNLMIGFYLNELIIQFLHRDDPHPEIYQSYQSVLAELESGDGVERSLRMFERDLLQEIGYGLILEHDADSGAAIEADKLYTYYPAKGPVISQKTDNSLLQIHGSTLLGLATGNISDTAILPEAKRLMRYLITWQMGGKPLKTRELFKQHTPG